MSEKMEYVCEAHPGDTVRAKWSIDGAKTPGDAADMLEAFARWLRGLHYAGWTFDKPVQDDYGHLVDPDGNRGWLDEYDDDWGEDAEPAP